MPYTLQRIPRSVQNPERSNSSRPNRVEILRGAGPSNLEIELLLEALTRPPP